MDAAFSLAERIIYSELAKNDDTFYGLFQKAALHVSNVDRATLKTGPRGYALALKDTGRFEGAVEGLDALNVVLAGDDDGYCVFETPLGTIDAGVQSQLARAKKILFLQE
jgi:flagellar assembly protein FliH